jgi:hypothetical protein
MLRTRTRYRIGTAVFLLVLVWVAAFGAWSGSQSQQPSIGAGPQDSRPENSASEGNQSTKPDDRGTPNAPFVVKVLTAPQSDKESADIANAANQEAANGRGLLWLTGALGCVAFLQRGVMLWQACLLRHSVKASESAARAAQTSADAAVNIELPIFAKTLLVIPVKYERYIIRFTNCGRSPAIILEDCLVIKTYALALPDTPIYPTANIRLADMDSVVEYAGVHNIDRESSVTLDEWTAALYSKTQILAYGYFDYLDFLKVRHREGFCFIFMPEPHKRYPAMPPSKGRFYRDGRPAYSYNEIRKESS